jgi:hypothetical protein
VNVPLVRLLLPGAPDDHVGQVREDLLAVLEAHREDGRVGDRVDVLVQEVALLVGEVADLARRVGVEEDAVLENEAPLHRIRGGPGQ